MSLTLRQKTVLELQRLRHHTDARLHPLRSLFWECTLRCNMHCRHCGSDCRADASQPDMPAADFLQAIDTLTPHVNPHTTFIIITGGEPLLRHDLEQVGTQLYQRGYPWGAVSNGYLLDAQRLDSLLAAGMHSMSISLDGLAPQHNAIRGLPQSHARATRAIDLLAGQTEAAWDVVTCVSPLNIDTLDQFKESLVDMGVRSWRLFSIAPMGRAATDAQLQLSNTQLQQLMQFIRHTRQTDARIDASYACEGFLGSYEMQVRDQPFYCRAGIEVASIRCDGSISGCTSIRSAMAQGNIYTDSLWQVWNERFGIMRNRQWARKGACSSCKVWRYCEGSGMHLYDDSGTLLTCHYQRLGGK